MMLVGAIDQINILGGPNSTCKEKRNIIWFFVNILFITEAFRLYIHQKEFNDKKTF